MDNFFENLTNENEIKINENELNKEIMDISKIEERIIFYINKNNS